MSNRTKNSFTAPANLFLMVFLLYFLGILEAYVRFNYIVAPQSWVYVGLLVVLLMLVVGAYVVIRSLLPRRKYEINIPIGLCVFAIFILIAGISMALVMAGPASPSVQTFFKLCLNLASIGFVYLIFFFSWYCLGRRITDFFKITIHDRIGSLILAEIAGIAGCIIYFYFCSLIGFVSPLTTTLFIILCLTIGWPFVGQMINRLRRPIAAHWSFHEFGIKELRTIVVAVLLTYTVFAFISTSTGRPVDPDSAKTYAYIPYLIIQKSALIQFPYEPLNNSSFASSYLYIPFVQSGAQFVLYLNIFLLWLLLGTIYYAGKKYFNEGVGLRACLLFMTMDFIFLFLTTAKTDFLLTLLIGWVILLTLRAIEKNQQTVLFFAGLLFGISVAVKYNALFIGGGFLLLFLFGSREKLTKKIENLIIFFGAGILAFAPWGMRSLLLFATPLYPYSLFGSIGSFTPAARMALRAFDQELSAYTHILRPQNSIVYNIYLIATNQSNYAYNKLGPLFFGLLPFIFTRRVLSQSKNFLLLILPTIVIWYVVSVSQVWYIMYLLPIAWICIAAGWSRITSRTINSIVGIVIVMLLISNIRPNQLHFVQTLYAGDYQAKYLSDPSSIESYIVGNLAPKNQNYLILPFGDIDTFSVQDQYLHVIDNDFMVYWLPIIAEHTTPWAITELLQSKGITHLYYSKKLMAELEQNACTPTPCPTIKKTVAVLNDVRSELPIVHETDDWILYALP